MLLIFGKRTKRRKKGYVALYCSCCRMPTAAHATCISEIAHIYYISVGNGKSLFYETKCSICGLLKSISLNSFQDFIDEPDIDQALLKNTTYGLSSNLNRFDEYEQYILSDEASREDRLADIRNVIDGLSYMAEVQSESSNSESITALVQLGMIISGIGVVFAFAGYAGGIYAYMWYALAVFFVALVAYRMVVTSKRTKFRCIFKLLVLGLKPLNPTLDELEQTVSQMHDHPLRKVVKPRKLFEALHFSESNYTKQV